MPRKRRLQDFDSPGIIQDTLPLDSIAPPLYNPRTYFDEEKLRQLAESFKEHGMLGRLTVRPIEGKERPYELVVGERRFRAAQLADLAEAPVDIKELTDQQAIALALEENLNREDLNPIEETEGILQLLSLESELEKPEITSLLYKMIKGRDVPTHFQEALFNVFEQIKNLSWQTFARDRLRLLKLPEAILEAIKQGKIEYTKGIEIAKVPDELVQNELLQEAITNNLSISQIKEQVAQHKGKQQTDYSQLSIDALIKDVRQTYQRFSRNKKIWSDSRNRKKIETLLKQLKTLVEE